MEPEIIAVGEEMDAIGWSEMTSAVTNEVRPTAVQLQQAANEYLAFIKDVQKEMAVFEAMLKKQSALRKQARQAGNSAYNEIDEYIRNKEKIDQFLHSDIPSKIYQATFAFQQQLNLFLGQQVKMIFVYQGAGGPEIYQITGEELVPGYNKNKLSARYKFNNLQKVRVDLDELDQGFVNGVKATYAEVMYRWGVTRAHNNHVILWQIPKGNWFLMSVSSAGDLNEAYATIIIQNQQPPTFQNDMEVNVRDFMTYVSKVDNASGLLQGDTSKNGIEFGIKSEGASALGLKQVYDIAKDIKEITDPGQIEKYLLQKQQQFRARGRTRNKAIHMADMKYSEIMAGLDKGEKAFIKEFEILVF